MSFAAESSASATAPGAARRTQASSRYSFPCSRVLCDLAGRAGVSGRRGGTSAGGAKNSPALAAGAGAGASCRARRGGERSPSVSLLRARVFGGEPSMAQISRATRSKSRRKSRTMRDQRAPKPARRRLRGVSPLERDSGTLSSALAGLG